MLDMDFEPKIEEENFTNEPILGALEECPLSSLRQIAKRILIPMSAVRYHLVNFLGIKAGTFDGSSIRSHRARTKQVSR
jgi:predicted transcriptional regulator